MDGDTDHDGLSDGSDSDPLDNLGDPPEMIFVEVKEIHFSNTPFDTKEWPTINMNLRKNTSFLLRLSDVGGKKVYSIDGGTDDKRLTAITPSDYTASIQPRDGCYYCTIQKGTHPIELPFRFSGSEGQGGQNWNFHIYVRSPFYDTWPSMRDKKKCICENGNVSIEYTLDILTYLGLGHCGNMSLPKKEGRRFDFRRNGRLGTLGVGI
jgi:hypothetical protein